MTDVPPVRPGGAMVEFDGVGLRYGPDAEILSDISFNLQPGSFYFLTGASGAGKTSLLKMLYLAQRPSRGIVRRSEEHTSELQSLMRISYAVFCLKKKKNKKYNMNHYTRYN